ncbi:recombinase family protein [Brevibacillus laterosporus]|uniref:recombinase family protein n=1 Tax=Brevibacillus sp. 7WMA2 TaxID=2683193 RepID=UPI0020B12982|nr:recombinase family protein [Brevibacillus sp. 7WMA2]MCR8995810.1 recombinase family protein [Brevibacillus laterosporus]
MHDILRNEKYSGVYVFKKTASKNAFGKRNGHAIKDDKDVVRVPDGMPALISPEDYQKVFEKMKGTKRSPAAYEATETYLLSGMIVCGECLEKHDHEFAMMDNSHPIARNKMTYVTYRSGNRDNKKNCDN